MGFSLRWLKPPFWGRPAWLVSLANKPHAREIVEQKWSNNPSYPSIQCRLSPPFVKSLWYWDVGFRAWRTWTGGSSGDGGKRNDLPLNKLMSSGFCWQRFVVKFPVCYVPLMTCLFANTGLPLPPLATCLRECYFQCTILNIIFFFLTAYLFSQMEKIISQFIGAWKLTYKAPDPLPETLGARI